MAARRIRPGQPGAVRQYHLCGALDPAKLWWESIDLPVRTAQVVDVGGGATIAPLICEDLARLDEVADVLRRVGPSLVIALLLDGPQLPQRWPARYATCLLYTSPSPRDRQKSRMPSSA